MPKNTLGKWSLILIVVMPVLMFIGSSLTNTLYEGVSSGDTIPQDLLARPLLATLMLAGFGCGIAAFVTGLITIIKDKERAALVFISTLLGALVIVYLILEIAFPH